MDKKYDVFVSYSRKDTDVVEDIRQAFDAHGITYFIDQLGINGGLEFPQVIAEAIANSTVFLFLGSKNSYASKFTNSEITFAFNKKDKKNILPYIIDDSALPINLEFVFSNINVRNIKNHPIEPVLVNDILSLMGKPEITDTPIQLRKKSMKPIAIAAILGGAAIAIGIAAMFFFMTRYTQQPAPPASVPVQKDTIVIIDKPTPDELDTDDLNTDRYVGRVKTDNVCLRSQPDEDHKLTGSDAVRFNTGELLQVTRIVDNYYQVEFEGAEYYIPKYSLSIERGSKSPTDVPKYVCATSDNVCLRSQPNEATKLTGNNAPHIYKGELYRCTAIVNGYYAIQYNDSTYYLPMRYAAPN